MTPQARSDHRIDNCYRGLFGPWADTLMLGGGSIIALLILQILQLNSGGIEMLAVCMLVLANFVNHPHFSYSYQIFYSSWREVKGRSLPVGYCRRWWLAAVVIPVLLAVGLLVGAGLWVNGKPFLLGLMLTSMGVLVGWHYVKQGFGMAMMDAALKKLYWPHETRRALLINAYFCWVAAFTFGRAGNLLQEAWGIVGIDLAIPGLVTVIACSAAAITTIWCSFSVYRTVARWIYSGYSWGQWPFAGIVAYYITLYLWLGFIQAEPGFVFVIPFFHSLQYLTVIARYKINETGSESRASHKLFLFAGGGVVLGGVGFWLLPWLIDYLRTGALPSYKTKAALAVGSVWIFINVHHYFIDSVLWRKENVRANKFLFEAR